MNPFEGATKKASGDAVAAAEKYLYERLQELGLPKRTAHSKPSRITRQSFVDREEYFEYWLDQGQSTELFLFCEILDVVIHEGKFCLKQDLSCERQFPP